VYVYERNSREQRNVCAAEQRVRVMRCYRRAKEDKCRGEKRSRDEEREEQ
jgi:hypothetical protein